jgi:hypothetical protein
MKNHGWSFIPYFADNDEFGSCYEHCGEAESATIDRFVSCRYRCLRVDYDGQFS